ncbi:MAG: flagellar protein FlaG [Thermodesulfovibrio sp.]|nr:flagellar protein FlaG [Thermodesulfovibrio sp.]
MRLDGIGKEIIAINPYKNINVQSFKQASKDLETQVKPFSQIDEIKKEIQKPFTISQEELNKLVEKLKHKFNMIEKYLKIDIDEQLKMPISKIIDMRTEEIIRQIPPDWIVDILRRMEELKGVFYTEEV